LKGSKHAYVLRDDSLNFNNWLLKSSICFLSKVFIAVKAGKKTKTAEQERRERRR